MKKIILLFLLLNKISFSQQINLQLAKNFIKKLENRQFDSAHKFFDTIVSNKISSEMLEQMWGGFSRVIGEYKGYTKLYCEPKKETDTVIIALCEFEKSKLNLQLHFNKVSLIDGIYFLPPKNTKAYNRPTYYDPSKFYETKIDVQTKAFKMPGILTIPNNSESPPVIILISGSGPNDKDESIGPNKPFKDIALGLAINGIASLRFDKRTLVYGKVFLQQNTPITLKEEYIQDALTAIKLIKKNTLTKNSKIYLLGHSLGASCIASITNKTKNIKGVVLMAATARKLEDVILDQYTYILGLDGKTIEDSTALFQIQEKNKLVKNKRLLKKAKADQLPLNMPSIYWQSINKTVTINSVKNIKQPILFLQGGRDYQVTTQDFEIWKKELMLKTKNKFLFYENLNHLFMTGIGKSTPSEYEKIGNVDLQVILDIANWIHSK